MSKSIKILHKTITLLCLATGLTAGEIQFLNHKYGPMAVLSAESVTKAILNPNDLEVSIRFKGEGKESVILTSSSPDVPKITGMWRDGEFIVGDSKPLKTAKRGKGKTSHYTLKYNHTKNCKISLIWYPGGLVEGQMTVGDKVTKLTGSNYRNGAVFLVSPDLSFGFSATKGSEDGKITWFGLGSGDTQIEFKKM